MLLIDASWPRHGMNWPARAWGEPLPRGRISVPRHILPPHRFEPGKEAALGQM
jgi:hypothetical protein